MSKVNIKEVAEKAGVSIMSVSRAMNNKPGLGKKTREKILAIAKEMGYIPNLLAGNLARQSSKIIGVILPVIEHTNFPDMLRGVESVLSEKGYRLIFSCSYNDKVKESREINAMLQMQVDGILWCPSTAQDDMNIYELIKSQDCEVLFMDRLIENIPIDAVIVNDREGAYNAVKHLQKNGYKRIAHITEETQAWTSMERQRGYEEAIKDCSDNDFQLILTTEASVHGGKDAMERILELPKEEQPDAIFAFNDPIAIGLSAVLRSHQITNSQMGLVGYAATLASEINYCPLTSVYQDSQAIGELAAETLLRRVEEKGKDYNPVHHIVKTKLIQRESSQRS